MATACNSNQKIESLEHVSKPKVSEKASNVNHILRDHLRQKLVTEVCKVTKKLLWKSKTDNLEQYILSKGSETNFSEIH